MTNSALTTQVGGNHYKGMAIQPVEFALVNSLNAAQNNVVKYICRFPLKGGTADLQKALHYCDLWLEIFAIYHLDWSVLDRRARPLLISIDTFVAANRFAADIERVLELVCAAPTPQLVAQAKDAIINIIGSEIVRASSGG